jgi:two-component system chemotaxis sensor kinase CheA
VIEDDEIVGAFLEESRENLAQLDEDLVALENRPDDPELLARVFRVIHTIKGTCGFLGYSHLEELTHAGESLLGSLRDGTLPLDADVTTTLLRLVDAVRAVLARVDATGQEGDQGHSALIAELQAHVGHDRPTVPLATTQEGPEPERAVAGESSVRVDVAALDRLMDLVGELVLARTRLTGPDDGELGAPERQLRAVTEELHAAVMQVRLQPIGNALGRLRRIVRDLGAALGKQVRLELEGEEVGVDKAVNEALRDPLLHLVRNAVDHGLETPSERAAAGKEPEGLLRIRAFHASGMVRVEVSDDGRGVDPEALVAHAVAAGVLSEAEAAQLTDRKTLDLMFLPGLSTNDSVTNVSGRGVGMDVVRTHVQRIGGSVEVRSEQGTGTTFRLTVPLTLGIMPILSVTCGGQRYAVPTAHVHEVVALVDVEDAGALDELDGTRIYRLRGRLLPLAEMSELLGSGGGPGGVMVVVETDGTRFGLVVDAVGDTSDIVVKPLTSATADIPYFSAVTILDDGRPSLILDLAGIAAGAGIERGAGGAVTEDDDVDEHGDDLLVAIADGGGRLVLRLQDVERLEELDPATLERAGEVDVVQYREMLLPIIRVSELLPERRSQPRETIERTLDDRLCTIVCQTSVGSVGIVVADVADIVPHPDVPLQPASREGVEACVVVEGHVAEILDIEALVARAGLRPRHG